MVVEDFVVFELVFVDLLSKDGRLLISEDLSVEAVLPSLLPTFYQPANFEER